MANENGQKNLIIEEEAGLFTLTMNRPEKRNALSTAMMTELNDALVAIGNRSDARGDNRGQRPRILGGSRPRRAEGSRPRILPL